MLNLKSLSLDDAEYGRSEISTDTKKVRQRKPQTEQEYLQQKNQFHAEGPAVSTEDWLYDIERSLESNNKCDRIKILNACERAYFTRNYNKCLELVRRSEGVFMSLEGEGDGINSSNSVTKSMGRSKTERYLVDLMYIKTCALEKLKES